jgi:hypothetical protein
LSLVKNANNYLVFFKLFEVSLRIKILFPLLLLFGILVAFLGLNYSHGVNNFVFSNIINPYDPLDVQTSKPIKKNSLVDDYWKDPRGLFPIFAYNLPEKTNDLSASLKIIERSGINIIINSNMGWIVDAKKVKSAFEELKNSNLKWIALIENECKDDFIFRNANDETNIKIKDYLEAFNDENIYGWYLWDEPGNNRKACTPLNLIPNDDNADINTMAKQIRSDTLFNKKLDFVNLFPTYWDGTPSTEEYEKYIDAFIASQEFKPRVLCFDSYPLLKNEYGGFRKDYYSNLEIIRKKSLEYNIPFWMIVMSSEHDYYKKPTFEEISLQVYSALAYGAKGIGYYLYARGWETLGYKSWILEDYVDNLNVADSLHGDLFVLVQKLNKSIQTLGKILLNLKSTEIIHTSDYPNKQEEITQSLFKSNKANSLIKQILNTGEPDTDSKLLIGIFEEKNKLNSNGKYLFIVNKDVNATSNITTTLNGPYNIYKFDKETGEKKFINTNENISSKISEGTGELFYIE